MSREQSPALGLPEGLSRGFLVRHRLCPTVRRDDGTLVVAVGPGAVADDAYVIAEAYHATGCVIEEVSDDGIDRLIERLAMQAERSIEITTLARDDDFAADATADVRDLTNHSAVVRYVNLLIREAYDASASDIHIEARQSGLTVRLRVDGVLAPAPEPPAQLQRAVVSRIKLLAQLDIAERRRPQDGRIRVRLETRELDVRVSTVPTMHGESVVLRLLDHGGGPAGLQELGMAPAILAAMTRLAARPHGMILVTGPTGSGKTTTLYACLALRDATSEKVVTVEDPIEYQLESVTQVPVHLPTGVTFGSALRSILRQDPDVILIGEMRDAETAEIAVQASMTGHLVLSTLHTNDAVGAIPRLLDLGVQAYLVAATVDAVLAQRLVRRVCRRCGEPYRPSAEQVALIAQRSLRELEGLRLWRGVGCAECYGTGYRGRVGLFELLVVNDAIREAVAKGSSRATLQSLAAESGMTGILADGWSKVEAGLTTVEEVLRVSQL